MYRGSFEMLHHYTENAYHRTYRIVCNLIRESAELYKYPFGCNGVAILIRLLFLNEYPSVIVIYLSRIRLACFIIPPNNHPFYRYRFTQ